jgi:phage-related protein
MAAGAPTGITVGHANIVVTPVLSTQHLGSLGNSLNGQLTQMGRAGGSQLISSLSASANAGPVRARFGIVGRNLAAAVIGGFAAAGIAKGIAKVISSGIDETKDFAAGQARLTAGLKSTGSQAGVTVGQLEDLASSIQNYSGQTDDSIVSTEQLLLTFTNIKNVAGAGNDVFTQTTKIAADMAARLGGDASASAIQLGKALNDPIKGVTALQRVGVSFDEGQKATIKTLVQSGNTLGAQKIILAELNKEFGGSAKAVGDSLPGQINRAKRSFEDLSQSVVGALLPAFDRVLPGVITAIQWLGPKLTGAVNVTVGAIGKVGSFVSPVLRTVSSAWDTFVGGFQNPGAKLGPGVTGSERLFLTLGSNVAKGFAAVRGIVSSTFSELVPIVSRFLSIVGNAVGPILSAFASLLGRIGSTIAENVTPILHELGDFVTSSVLPAFGRVVGLIRDNVVPLFQHLGDVFARDVIPAIRTFADFVIRNVLPILLRIWEAAERSLIPALAKLGRVLIDVVGYAFRLVTRFLREHQAQITTVIRFVGELFKVFFKVAGWIISTLAPVLGVILKRAFDIIVGIIGVVIDIAAGLINVFHSIGNAGLWLWNNALKPAWGAISTAWHDLATALKWANDNLIQPVWDGIQAGVQAIAAAFAWVKTAIGTAWDDLVKIVTKPIDITLGIINKFDGFVDDVLEKIGLNRPLPTNLSLGLANGGRVPGSGSGDIVPAMLTPGEVVMSVPAVKRYGLDYLLGLNAQKFAGGGQALPITPYAYGSGQHGSYGIFNPLSAAFDTGKWVLDQGQHLLRLGAAAALSAAVAPVRALLNQLGNAGVGGWIHHAGNWLFDDIIKFVKGKESSDLVGVEGGSGVPTGSAQLIAQRLLPAFGWGSDQFPPLQTLWNGESGWRWDALNPDSGAYGIPQSLPADKMASAGADWRTNPETQERWGMGYIKSAYGSPAQALAAWLSRDPHWYARGGEVTPLHGSIPAGVFDRGGILPSGAAAFNFSGRPEGYLDPDESRALKAVLSGATGGGARPGLFAGANVVIGDNVDLEAYDRKHDWQQRQGRAR